MAYKGAVFVAEGIEQHLFLYMLNLGSYLFF
jgi:hypothetical protein